MCGIALLLGSAVYSFKDQFGFAHETRVKADLQSIATSLLVYQGRNGFLPTTEQGLKALVVRPDTSPRPRQWSASFDKVPRDPWENEYKYVSPGTHSDRGYDLYSTGADGKDGTADDIGNWEKKE